MASVELKKVAKSYENSGPVIHGIDLKIKKGEFMVLVGPSGCGKSTTLRMIAGLEEVTDGELMINDKKVNDVAPKDRNIAMVFQNYALYPHMTVYENIAFGLKLAKLPKEEIDSRVKSVAKSLEIDHLLDRKPKNMSGGQRQRVALGRAIARRASVYLFDEPLSNLDAQLRVSMRVRLAQLNSDLAKQGLENTMIYVTHDQVEAMTLGHRICVMESGYIRQVDTPLNLYRYPANKFVAEFIGSPSMNFTQGVLEKSSTEYEVIIKGYKCVIPKEKAVLLEAYIGKIVGVGVRAEHIHLKKDDPSFGFKGEISVVEHMGNEDFIYLKYNDTLFVCRSQDHINVVPEDPNCYFNFEPEHIHLFDLETEQNISLPESRITETTAPSTPDISNIEIIELLGGKSNIIEVNSCISRVRVIVKEDKNVKLLEMRKRGLNVVQAKEQHVHIVLGVKSKDTAAEIFRQIQ